MPKRYSPTEKTFQPIEKALLAEVLDDGPPVATPQSAPPRSTAAMRERKVLPLDPVQQAPRQELSNGPQTRERLTAPLKVHLHPGERRELNRLLNHLSQEIGATVSASHLQRALITLLLHAESEILKRVREHAPMKRPPNDNLAAIAAFEFRLAKILCGGLRQAPPLRESPRE